MSAKTSSRLSLLAIVCASFVTAAQAGPSNLWTDNVISESQAIPLTTPNQGLARARQLMADGDYERAARALNKVVTRWPTCEEGQRLLAQSLARLEGTALTARNDKTTNASKAAITDSDTVTLE